MKEWKRILKKVLETGIIREDRTGTGTRSLFGETCTFNNSTTFPAVTTKKLFFGPMAAELSCFLHGAESIKEFKSLGCNIWDGNGIADYWVPKARFEGDLGRIYGVQWKRWRSPSTKDPMDGVGLSSEFTNTDQIDNLVKSLKQDPFSRRHIVTALNPGELHMMCLPPCHVLFQCYVRNTDCGLVMDMRVDMRSVDLFLGLPFDIASYALLQRLLCKEVGYQSGKLVFQLGDAHIYNNHIEQVQTILERKPFKAPTLQLDAFASVYTFKPNQAMLVDYKSHSAVKAALNV